ncbi:MAG: hypothetical protein M3N98_03235, partial [Actinomycetota bacterium]|nr:hypothetical protein [Actinomycetota bacterium]
MEQSTVDDALRHLALGLEALRHEHAPPAWAEVCGPMADPVTVRWHQGVETMFGFAAPSRCDAIGVVANGWARGLDSGPPGSISVLAPGVRRRVRMVCLVTRDGRTAGHMRTGARVLIDQPPGAGRVLDCMLRCFGLPTPPPATSTDAVLAALWLGGVEQAAQD